MPVHKLLLSPGGKMLASAGLLLIASRLLNWHDLADVVACLDGWHLFVASAGAMAILLFLAARWALMARESDLREPIRHFRHFLFGICISSVTPANIGADVYRFAMLQRDGKNWGIIGLLVQEGALLLMGYLLSIVGAVVILGIRGERWSTAIAYFYLASVAYRPWGLPSPSFYRLSSLSRQRFLVGRPKQILDSFQCLIALGPPDRYLPLLGLSLLRIMSWLGTVTAARAA